MNVIQSFQLVIRKTLNICLSGIKRHEIKLEWFKAHMVSFNWK